MPPIGQLTRPLILSCYRGGGHGSWSPSAASAIPPARSARTIPNRACCTSATA